jgi:hypothetical protein
MAEGKGIEPLHAFRRDLRLASECITALPAFRIVVGQVGVEPTKSPRSERGAFTSLTTARMVPPVGFEPTLDRLSTC